MSVPPVCQVRRRSAAAARLLQHAAEDVAVERPERVPVDEAEQAGRVEDRRLRDRSSPTRLRSATTSNCSQARPGTFISALSRSSRSGSNASTRQKSSVSPTRGPPGRAGPAGAPARRRARRAARAAARAARPSTSPSRRRSPGSARTPAPGGTATAIERESTRREPRRTPPYGVSSANASSDQRVSAIAWSSKASARAIASRTPRGRTGNDLERARVLDDRLVPQRVDELAADAGVDGRDEPEPEAREPRRQHRHRDHRPAQASLRCVLLHQLEVGDAVGAADLVDLAALGLAVERLEQVGEHVLDRDRLRAHAHPARRHHHRAASRRAPGSSRTRRCPSRSRSRRGTRSSGRPRRAGSGRPPGATRGGARGLRGRGRRGRRSSALRPLARPRRTPAQPPGRPRRTAGSSSSSAPGSRRCRRPRAPAAIDSGCRTSPCTTSVVGATLGCRYSGRRERQRTRSPRSSSACSSRPPT